jgi:NTE family protein
MLGLVLAAGGARGAYQAGVLKRLGELPSLRDEPAPFPIVAGASAGAINGSLLAARGAHFGEATREIARVWSNLRTEDVYHSDLCSLARTGAGLALDFALGNLLGRTRTHGLLDTTPLARTLARAFPPRGIAEGIRRGRLYAVAVSATSYHSGRSFTFVEGRNGHPVWQKSRRLVLPVTLTHRHVMGSCAIPIVFPPVQVASQEGDLWFGDGGLRLVTPLSPAIRLGATRLLSIGVRSGRAADALAREEAGAGPGPEAGPPKLPCPPLAQVIGVFLNAIFLDHLDADLDHLERMNEIVAAGRREIAGAKEPIRPIAPLAIGPSEDLALVAQRYAQRMPRLLRIALEALGTPDAQSADLMSYLLFDAAYTRTLVGIGYEDAAQRAAELEAFVREAAPPPALASSASKRRPARPAARIGAATPPP